MSSHLNPLHLRPFTSDPSNADGDVWYRTDLQQIKANMGGSVFVLGPDLLAVPFGRPGPQTVLTNAVAQIPVPFDCVYEGIVVRLSTVPTGATTFKLDWNYDGTTIWSTTHTNQPTWVASANLATVAGAPNVNSFVAGHYWTWDVDAVGSTIAGSDLAGWFMVRRS